MSSFRCRFLIILGCFLSFSLLRVSTVQAVSTPDVAITASSPGLLSDAVNIEVTLRNLSADTGFFPQIEVLLPEGIECDAACLAGIVTTSLNDTAVDSVLLGPGAGDFTQPETGEIISLAAGENYLVLTPPLGSLSLGQPDVVINIPANFSASAIVGDLYNIQARGLFALGDFPNGLRGACGDPSADTTCSAFVPIDVSPTVLVLGKQTTPLFEGATATGPNYPRSFTISADIATGETVENVVISDTIPDELIIDNPPDASCVGGSFAFNPVPDVCIFTEDPNGGGSFTATYNSLLGVVGDDIIINYEGYVQEFIDNDPAQPTIDPTSGATTTSQNLLTLDFNYQSTPMPQVMASAVIVQSSTDLIKTSALSNDVNAVGISPGDTIDWTLRLYISDYFNFTDNLQDVAAEIVDTMGDGQDFVDDSLQVAVEDAGNNAVALEAALELGGYLVFSTPSAGVTVFELDLTEAMIDGEFGASFNDGVLNGSTTQVATVTITYQTVIREDYQEVFAGGNTSIIGAGDTINNQADAALEVEGGDTVNVGDGADVVVANITTSNKIVAFKNGADPAGDNNIAPNDDITYLISTTIPTGDVENFVIQDFLPQPIFNVLDPNADGVGEAWAQIADCDLATPDVPAPGEWCFTTDSDVNSGATINTVATGNLLEFDFGDNLENLGFSNALNVEVVFTLRATFEPMSDGLQLVNLASITHANSESEVTTNSVASTQNHVIQEPSLGVMKEVLSVDDAGATISNGDLSDVDAGALVTFQVAIENTGAFTAFDVLLVDNIPTGFVQPVAGFGISASPECGAANTTGTTASQINVANMEVASGATCLVSYQVLIDLSAQPEQEIINTATVTYAGIVGGTTFAPEVDMATTTLISPQVTKALESSSGEAAPGDSVTFSIEVVVPEGTLNNMEVRDVDVGNWLDFDDVNVGTVSFVGGLNAGVILLTPVWCVNPVGLAIDFSDNICFTQDPESPLNYSNSGATNFIVSFGNAINGFTDDVERSFTIEVTGTINSSAASGNHTNRGRVYWDNPNGAGQLFENDNLTFTSNAPDLDIVKCATATTLENQPVSLADSVSYVLQLRNAGDNLSTAYDISVLQDNLNQGLRYLNLNQAFYCSNNADVDPCEHNWAADGDCTDVFATVNAGVAVEDPILNNGSDIGAQQLVEFPVVGESNTSTLPPNAYFVVSFTADLSCENFADNTGTDLPIGEHPDGDGIVDGCLDPVMPFQNNFPNNAVVSSYSSQDGVVVGEATYGPDSSNLVSLTLDHDGDGINNQIEGDDDVDGDGVPDYLDTDSDDNGQNDTTEYDMGNDQDNDGIPDAYDLDNDGDNADDSTEITSGGGADNDADGDGTPDFMDPDSDNDGVSDGDELNEPTDMNTDGQADGDNHNDLDSDDDGIPDMIEYGLGACDNGAGADAAGDGELGPDEIAACSASVCIADPCDSDGNGAIESDEFVGGTLPDTDGDGLFDAHELDSDNDGLRDFYESGLSSCDANMDSFLIEVERLACDDGANPDVSGGAFDDNNIINPDEILDSDNDGIFDFIDIDSDNDGVPDIVENGRYVCDANVNGQIDYPAEVDPGCTPDLNANGFIDPEDIALTNTDAVDEVDYLDLDSDNDGIHDWIEAYPSSQLLTVDANNNGEIEQSEYDAVVLLVGNNDATLSFDELNEEVTAEDADTIPDIYDDDSDGDGILDLHESDATEVYPNYDFNSMVSLIGNLVNTDGDSYQPDFRDLDSDDDGLPDNVESGDMTIGTPPIDTDGDGVPDFQDLDSDDDGLSDADEIIAGSDPVDPDSDNDGCTDGCEVFGNTPANMPMPFEACPYSAFPWGETPGTAASPITDPTNANTDGAGDPGLMCVGTGDCDEALAGTDPTDPTDEPALDDDIDNDGCTNQQEQDAGTDCTVPDTDGDGCEDCREIQDLMTNPLVPDTDGDGCEDCLEADTMGTNPLIVDTDGDTLGDCDEAQIGTNPLDPDTDGDGVPDNIELDSGCMNPTVTDTDNDGLTDGEEVNIHGTDPCDEDTDDGGVPDGLEINDGTDPLDREDDRDTDGDGITDIIEERYGSDPFNPNSDNDDCSLNDGQEWGPDLFAPPLDTDGDGVPNVLDVDSDNDGFTDCVELRAGTDPLLRNVACLQGSGTNGHHDRLTADQLLDQECGASCYLQIQGDQSSYQYWFLLFFIWFSLILSLRRKTRQSFQTLTGLLKEQTLDIIFLVGR